MLPEFSACQQRQQCAAPAWRGGSRQSGAAVLDVCGGARAVSEHSCAEIALSRCIPKRRVSQQTAESAAMASASEGAPKLCSQAPQEPEASVLQLPDDVLSTVLALLSQKQRAQAALVCRRWAAVSRTAAALWEVVELALKLPDAHILDRTEAFLSWLIPRARAVTKLTIAAARDDAAAAAAGAGAATGGGPALGPLHVHLVWSNLVSSLTLLRSTLCHLTIEWPDELQLGAWVATLGALESASFSAPRILVRPGLGSLSSLTDLRFRSSKKPLTFAAAAASPGRGPGGAGHGGGGGGAVLGAPLLPAQLVKLRLEGCHLSELPAHLTRLSCLEDLVLSDNNLQAARLTMLSRLTTLQQLTMMGCNMTCLPPALAALRNLRVLYLDMGIQAPSPEMPPMHRQCDALLGQLEHLGILSMGPATCRWVAFPAELACHTALRALYLDDNSMTSLPAGAYLEGLRVLGIDWRVLFNSHAVLRHAPRLSKLCLMSMGKLEVEAGSSSEADVAAVVASLAEHPSLQQVLLPSLDGHRSQLYIAALNVLIGIARAPHLEVKAVTYHGIGNEWLDWLRELQEQEEEERQAGHAQGQGRGGRGEGSGVRLRGRQQQGAAVRAAAPGSLAGSLDLA